jgi:hypothetical protein
MSEIAKNKMYDIWKIQQPQKGMKLSEEYKRRLLTIGKFSNQPMTNPLITNNFPHITNHQLLLTSYIQAYKTQNLLT